MSDASIAAIVVAYNSAAYIGPCLAALNGSTVPVDIVVVDNDSRDDTVARVRSDHPGVTVIEQENLGYAAGNNRGLERLESGRYRYVFIVNPDVAVDSNCIERLAALMDENLGTAIACPKIYYPDGRTIWFAGSTIDWATGSVPHRGGGQVDTGNYSSVDRMDRACGAAMLVRMSAIQQVGPMTEDYFLYFEETDWSRRFIDAGHDLLFCPSATCRHDVSSSTGVESPLSWYYMTRNNLLFMSRFGQSHWATFRLALRRRTWREVRRWLRKPGPGNLTRILAVSKGYSDFARGRFGRGW